MSHVVFFFFKQKTAYEMRISDWSSDVCSSDLWKFLNSCRKAAMFALHLGWVYFRPTSNASSFSAAKRRLVTSALVRGANTAGTAFRPVDPSWKDRKSVV